MLSDPVQLLNVYENSSVNFQNLCSCIYCWSFDKTRKCRKCKKLHCKNHIENHRCFTNREASFFV